MQFSIPLFNGRVAPRCTVADSILFGTVRRGHITYSHKIEKIIRTSMDLLNILMEHKAKVLVCGGVDRNTRQELEDSRIAILPNISGEMEEVLNRIKEGEINLSSLNIEESTDIDSFPHVRKSEVKRTDSEKNNSAHLESENVEYDEHDILEVAYDLNFEEERRLCRLSELVYFCLEMGFKSVGVAYCSDLTGPADILVNVLRRFFIVHPVSCSPEDNTYRHGNNNSYCNPKLQADILNQLGTDLNVIVGLCIGADCIFTKRSQAPVTTLFVKDKALANNPIGAIYSERYLREASHPILQMDTDEEENLTDIKTDRSLS